MTPITCAKPSPPRGRSPSSPTTLHVRSNIRSTSISMRSAISWNAASRNSSSSAASQPASKRPPEITGPSSLSQPSSYGCDKCPHYLERSHDREPHPASGCSRDDRGAGWRWLKRRHRDIFSTADTFAAALSSSAQQLLEPLICRCLAVPEHQDGSARACSSPPCPSK